MIIVDTALAEREMQGRPIRVGIVGAGSAAQGLVNQLVHATPGIRVVAVSNRHPDKAVGLYTFAGIEEVVTTDSQITLDDAISRGKAVATDDAFLIARSGLVDVVVEATGAVEFGAAVTLECIKSGKHVVLLNAELDATVGPILHHYAARHGVLLSASDGDEPGVQLNLYRWVKGLGLTPRVLGIVKGLQDPYRTPETQRGFAERVGQSLKTVTSSADGTKTSFEQAIVANATGFKVLSRGMSRGRDYTGDIMRIGETYDLEALRNIGGAIDYVVGTPLTKVYCLAEHPDARQRKYLEVYKMGKGPLYSFFMPYHLVHFEVPATIARVVLFGDVVAKPVGGPVVEVCALAKRPLKAGETLDDFGMFMTYGEAVNADEMCARRYLPHGLVEGCRLKRDIGRDAVLTYDDVVLPKGRLADRLRAEQYKHFRGVSWLMDIVDAASAPKVSVSTDAVAQVSA